MAEKILIVDDDVDSLKLIGLMLQRHGYEVVYANAGNQAISKATSEHPDLIILDVMMPDMNGYEVTRRLRGNPSTKPIPIIMFTAKTLIDDKVAGFEAGADDYLTKPTHPAELAARVKSILDRNTSQQNTPSVRGVTIGVVGSKGGVGTSTLALNLSSAFAQMDANPIIADFRLGAGSIGINLGQPGAASMSKMLTKPANEINPAVLEAELFKYQNGIRALLSSPRPREALVKFTVDSALAIISGLRSLGNPAVFDLGSGLTPFNSRLFAEMDLLIVVVEPMIVSLSMAQDLIKELSRQPKAEISVVVLNRNPNTAQPAWHEIENKLEHEIRAIISAAPELALQAAESATPIVNYQPNSIVASQIRKLAEDISTIEHTLG